MKEMNQVRPPQNAAATKANTWHSRISRHDDFVLKAAGGDDQEHRTHEEERHGVDPEMHPAGAAENDAAGDVDEISGGHEVAENIEKLGHRFTGEDISREKDAGKNGEESELHRFGLRIGFTGNQDAQRERHEDIRKGKQREQDNAAVDGHAEDEAHEGENHAQLEKADHQVGKQLAKQQAHGAHGSNEELLEGAALFFTHDRKRRQKRGDVEQENRGQAGKEEIGRAGIGIEKDFRAHVHRKSCIARVGEYAAQGLVEADGGGDGNVL